MASVKIPHRSIPANTNTAAYQKNPNIRVWVSTNPEDLKIGLSGKVVASEASMHSIGDPLNMADTLEKLDFGLAADQTKGFRLRLINPVGSMESFLSQHFNTVFAEEDQIREYQRRQRNEESRNDVSGVTKYELRDFQSSAEYPELFIRWGYGDHEGAGISSIHRAKLVDMEYSLNAKLERTVTLTLMDDFSFAVQGDMNPLAQQGLSAKVELFEGDTIKLPSVVLGELLSDFGNSFPNLFVHVNMDGGGFGDAVDSLVYRTIVALSELEDDKLIKLGEGEFQEEGIEVGELSKEEEQKLEEALKLKINPRQFLESLPGAKRKKNIGVVALAYNLIFGYMGFAFNFFRPEEEGFGFGTERMQLESVDSTENQQTESAIKKKREDHTLFVGRDEYVTAHLSVIERETERMRPATPEEISEIKSQFLEVTYDSQRVEINQWLRDYDVAFKTAGPVSQSPVVRCKFVDASEDKPAIFYKNEDGTYDKKKFLVSPLPKEGPAEITEGSVAAVKKVYARAQAKYVNQDTPEEQLVRSFDRIDDPAKPFPSLLDVDKRISFIKYVAPENETVLQGIQKVTSNLNDMLSDRVREISYHHIDWLHLEGLTRSILLREDEEWYKKVGRDPVAFALSGMGITKEVLEDSGGVVFIGDQQYLRRLNAQDLLKRVFSFPEITYPAVTDQRGNEVPAKNFLRIDVGTSDSIAVDLRFRGDARVLAGLQKTPQMIKEDRLFADLFSNLPKVAKVVNFLISENPQGEFGAFSFGDEVDNSQLLLTTEDIESLKNKIKEFLQDTRKITALEQGTNFLSPSDLAPEYLTTLLAAISNENKLDILFPLNGKVNNYFRVGGKTFSRGAKKSELTRVLDLNPAEQKLGEALERATNQSLVDYYNLTNEAWNLDLTLLGVPELDIVANEMSARYVELKVYEANGTQHWLSGVYGVVGIAHAIDTRNGYLTKLKLIKKN